MRALFFPTLILASALLAPAAQDADAPRPSSPLTAAQIMARVALNQDAAEHAREAFVYRQKIAVRLRDTHGKLVREEVTEYAVTPETRSSHKELVKFAGQYRNGSAMVSYDNVTEGQEKGVRNEIDVDLVRDLRDDLVSDDESKDGLTLELFPLTVREQEKYRFTLKGEESYQGMDVYRIAFQPKSKDSDTSWKGETLVSKADFQPLMITTKLAFGVPFMVRTALGTNLQGLGFSVEYRKFEDGAWFPVSYGTEFRLHLLFFYGRSIMVSLVNSDFRHADVKSTVAFESEPEGK